MEKSAFSSFLGRGENSPFEAILFFLKNRYILGMNSENDLTPF